MLSTDGSHHGRYTMRSASLLHDQPSNNFGHASMLSPDLVKEAEKVPAFIQREIMESPKRGKPVHSKMASLTRDTRGFDRVCCLSPVPWGCEGMGKLKNRQLAGVQGSKSRFWLLRGVPPRQATARYAAAQTEDPTNADYPLYLDGFLLDYRGNRRCTYHR